MPFHYLIDFYHIKSYNVYIIPIYGRGVSKLNEDLSASSLQVIDRAFMVLEIISQNREMTLNDIHLASKLNKASLSRILVSLCNNGYVCKSPDTGKFFLSNKAFEIGVKAMRSTDYYYFVKEALEDLSKRLDVVAQFSVEDNNELLCLESYNNNKSAFSVYTHVGVRSPLYATSAGKAILSTYQSEELFSKWELMNVKPYTKNTITSLDLLTREISQIRLQGYAVDREESELGLFCVGTVIRNYNQQPIGAISLSSGSMPPEKEAVLSKALLEKAKLLNDLLGFSRK